MSHVDPDITVTEELVGEVTRAHEKFCREIRKCDPREAALDLARGYKDAFKFIQPYLNLYTNPKILEIGSGNGFGLCYMLKSGLDVMGVEPGSEISFEGRFDTASRLLEANGITPAGSYLSSAHAENLPFEDNSFDIVFSIAVLEHVRDLEACMREAMRVVKPNGVVVMNVPNYNSFHEGHYNVMWLPFILTSKRVAKWYVRTIFRRPDYYIDELNFTTPNQFRRLREKLQENKALKIYYYCEQPLDRLSAVYYHLSQGIASNNRMLESLRRKRVLGTLLRISSGLISNISGRVGLAPVFNVVCSKNSEMTKGNA